MESGYYMCMEQSIQPNYGSQANTCDTATQQAEEDLTLSYEAPSQTCDGDILFEEDMGDPTEGEVSAELIDLAQAEYSRLLKEKWGIGGSTQIILLTDGVRVEGSLQQYSTSIRPEEGWDFLERVLGDEEGPADLRDLLDLDHLEEQAGQDWDEQAAEVAEEIIGSDEYVLHSDFLADAINAEYSDGHGGIKDPQTAAENAVERLQKEWKEEVIEKTQCFLDAKGIKTDASVWLEHADVLLRHTAEDWADYIETEWYPNQPVRW